MYNSPNDDSRQIKTQKLTIGSDVYWYDKAHYKIK